MDAENTSISPMPSKKNSRYPSKTCKYAGVTFRASRDKYQARIYKGNKEYNLGLFDVSADAALAYDVAHRLVKKISAAHGKEKETLEAYESDKNAPDWLDYGEDANANSGLDPDKLNFLRPLDFKVEREKELNESQIAGTQKHENCPKLDELRVLVHKEAIRVVKIIVGAIDGGTNNYRRKSKKSAPMQDGALQDGSGKGKKRRKSKDSASSDNAKENGEKSHPAPNAIASAWVPKDGTADLYYQGSGLGRPVPNSSRTKKKDHPFGAPPGGPMVRNNPEFMSNMEKSNLKSMMDDGKAPSFHNDRQKNGGDNSDSFTDKSGPPENQTLSSNDNNSFFSQDTLHAGNVSNKPPSDFNFTGMPSYYGMGMGGNNNDASGMSSNKQDDFTSSQSPENYREFFKNMRNYFPGVNSSGPMGQNNMPEDFQRMMFARAMGQNAGMSMMGMENGSSLNQGNLFSNGFGDQKKDNKQLENLKSMMQNGLDRSMVQGSRDGPNPGRISPSTLNMFRAGGFPSSQGSQSSYGGSTRDQLAGMYGGDRFSQQLRALQSSQYGLNTSSFGQFGGRGEGGSSRGDQQAFLQSYGQSNFPSGSNVAGSGGSGYNPAFDAQFFGMPGSSHQPPRNQGNKDSGKDHNV
mmetsp:Transcript_19181/g.40459  ORF Transcript_19181/g.40459 Transcript_19181/m.40459 type:complete len:633 (-) Transcript_19181:3227-5125(-)